MSDILLTGANGVVGYPLRQRLIADDVPFIVTSRDPSKGELLWDLEHAPTPESVSLLQSRQVGALIHCAPIWLLPAHLKMLLDMGVRRIVAFSSSSVTSKRDSRDVSENKLVQQLSDAEIALQAFCAKSNIGLTIFRPSMIYGYGRDQNITHIARFINRFGFMLLVGRASGLRQPVHADDLAAACLDIVNKPNSFNNTYVLAGAEVLTYRAMVERLFVSLNKTPRIISLPLPIFRFALKLAAWFGKFSYTPEMANRMNQNLNYDISAAQHDFDFSPQPFLSHPERDLPDISGVTR